MKYRVATKLMPNTSPVINCFDQWIIKKLIFKLKGQKDSIYM